MRDLGSDQPCSSPPIPCRDGADYRQGEQDEDRGQRPGRVQHQEDQDDPGEAVGKDVEDTLHVEILAGAQFSDIKTPMTFYAWRSGGEWSRIASRWHWFMRAKAGQNRGLVTDRRREAGLASILFAVPLKLLVAMHFYLHTDVQEPHGGKVSLGEYEQLRRPWNLEQASQQQLGSFSSCIRRDQCGLSRWEFINRRTDDRNSQTVSP